MRLTSIYAAAIVASAIAVGQAQQPAAPAAQQPAANQTPQQRPDPVPPEYLPRPSTTDTRANL